MCLDKAKKMQFLKDGIISLATGGDRPCFGTDLSDFFNMFFGKSITYYDSKTLKVVDKVTYDFTFTQYEENDDLIVLRDSNNMLRIVTKANKEQHIVTELLRYQTRYYSRFFFIPEANKVFYLKTDAMIASATYCLVNGQPTLKYEDVASFQDENSNDDEIVAVSYQVRGNEPVIKVLSILGEVMQVKCGYLDYLDQFLEFCHLTRNEVASTLEHHGFDWSDPAIFGWLSDRSDFPIIPQKKASIHSHANVILLGSSRRFLHIYCDKYVQGQVRITTTNATLKIDLNKLCEIDFSVEKSLTDKTIAQIGVIEIENGHRVVMLYCQRILVLEFKHDCLKRKAELKKNSKKAKLVK